VLDVGKKQEQQRQAELMQIAEQLQGVRRSLLAEEKKLQQMLLEIHGKPASERVAAQSFFMSICSGTDGRIRELKHQQELLEKLRVKKVGQLVELKRYNEGLEKLREKSKADFEQELHRMEQAELDEAARTGFARKLSGARA